MASSLLIVADLSARKAVSSIGGNSFAFPTFTGGEDISIALWFQQNLAGTISQVFPNLRSLRASIGLTDTAATGGSFALQIGSGGSTTANTTPDLPYNISAASLQSAINAIPALSGAGVNSTAWKDGNAFVVTFSDGQERLIAAARNDLDPSCLVRVRTSSLSEDTEHEITILQTPIASSNAFNPIVPPQPTVTIVQQATVDPSGTFKYPCIQNLKLDPTFQGTYTLSYNGIITTALGPTDGTNTIAAAINALFNQAGQSVTVTNPSAGIAQISFDGNAFLGVTQPLLEVAVITAPPGNPTISLSLDTPACFEALREADSPQNYYLEIVADICADGVDPTTATTWQTVPLFRQAINIQRPINWPGLEASTPINWASPPGPWSYVPFGANNIITGQQFYVRSIGNSTSTAFAITHNLGTQAIHLTVIDNGASGAILVNGEDYQAAAPNPNLITLNFPSAPGNSSAVVVISTAGPVAAFMEGLTVTTAQVEGLAGQLTSLNNAVANLGTLLPALSGAGAGHATSANGITIPFTPKAEVIGFTGTLPTPSATGTGFTNSQFSHRPPSLGTASSFDRELFRISLNESQFALGRTLQIDWGVSLQVLRPTCGVQYTHVVEIGEYTTEGSYLDINWNTTAPVFAQPIVLTEEMAVHSFGLTLNRGLVGTSDTITLTQQLYGVATGNNGAAPTNANFALRARLIDLETENKPDPRGWISYGVVPSQTAASGVAVAQAVISTA